MHPDTTTLVAYRDGELGEKQARNVSRHLESCGECARTLEEMKASWELLAAEGPYGTRNYRILLQATPLPGGRSFLHFSYAYESGALTRLATQAYLATFGRGKVGFTVIGRQSDGTPQFIGGMRALVERGAMRYFLALEAYLDALAATPSEQFEKRLDHWYSASERFPRQLHEIDRATYLDLKRADQQRRLASP